MAPYTVTWTIDDEDSETPAEAARRALDAQRRPGSTATVFDVTDTATGEVTQIDLDPDSNVFIAETLNTARRIAALYGPVDTAMLQAQLDNPMEQE